MVAQTKSHIVIPEHDYNTHTMLASYNYRSGVRGEGGDSRHTNVGRHVWMVGQKPEGGEDMDAS